MNPGTVEEEDVWVSAGFDVLEKKKLVFAARFRTPDCPASSH
jgi:hypothetical protein